MTNLVIFSPFALENGRGGEKSSIELALGLQRYYNVVLIDTNICIEKNTISKVELKQKIENIGKFERIKFATFRIYNKNFSFPYPWELLKLYKFIKKADIVYTSISFVKIDILFILFSLLIPKINFIIGFRKPMYWAKKVSLYNLRYRASILFFSIFKKRFYYHTISYHTKKYLESFYDRDKIFHIIHGIDLTNFGKNGKEKKNNNILKFIYVGALEDTHKGLGILLEAINQFLEKNKDLKVFFEFCGRGPLASNLKNLEKKFPQFIKYHGYVNDDKLPEIYQRNDVLLFSSRDEPFGRVLIEALASNLVIICSITIGSIEILKDKEFAFFIDKLLPEKFDNKIKEIYNLWEKNLNFFISLQESAKNYAFQEFSFSIELKMFKNLIELIKKNKINTI